MKILHTADWHLGKKLDRISRLEEQEIVMSEICGIADEQNVDVVLIAGDLFDNFNPSIEAEELFYRTVKNLSNHGQRLVVAIAGNHDSPERVLAPTPLARQCGILLIGHPNQQITSYAFPNGVQMVKNLPGLLEFLIPGYDYPLRLLHTAYANEFRMRMRFEETNGADLRTLLQVHWQNLAQEHLDTLGVNVLISHLFFCKENSPLPEEPEEEKPILFVGGASPIFSSSVPGAIQYTALGHLHRKQLVDDTPCPIVYAGSPLAYSFSEAGQSKYVVVAELSPGQAAQVHEIKLASPKPLLRERFEDIDAACEWLSQNQNAIVELTIKLEKYLTPKQKQRILALNPDTFIVPEFLSGETTLTQRAPLDLSQNVPELFSRYFQSVHGAAPNDQQKELFFEILAEEEEK